MNLTSTTPDNMPRESLPLERWPLADRLAWEAACWPGVRLQRGGAASQLKPVSRRDYESRYGVFLGFLDRTRRLQANLPAAAHVTPANVDAYLQEAKGLVSSVTLYNSISKLRRMAQILVPDLDLPWLIEIENDLALVMVPRSKFDRLVLTDVLIEAGLTLVEEASCSPNMSSLERARQHRNGLMVAMLAYHPIRLKNFAGLEIGRSFVEIKGRWWLVLSAAETKEGRPDERPVDAAILPALKTYLTVHRPVLARGCDQSSGLWLSSHNAKAMSYSAVENTISQTTRMTVGIDVSPHLFRTAIASTAAILSGEHPELGSALLHHADSRIRDKYYNRASSMTAGQEYLKVVSRYRKL
jgi:integrase